MTEPKTYTLNPFGNSNVDTLTKLICECIDDIQREDALLQMRLNRSFRNEMIENMDPSQTVGQALTAHLGNGIWSAWDWTADQAKQALSGLIVREGLMKWAMDDYDKRMKAANSGYVPYH